MTDDYECEGQMNIFEVLAKEPEANDSWEQVDGTCRRHVWRD